jgi:hypothetical protein
MHALPARTPRRGSNQQQKAPPQLVRARGADCTFITQRKAGLLGFAPIGARYCNSNCRRLPQRRAATLTPVKPWPRFGARPKITVRWRHAPSLALLRKRCGGRDSLGPGLGLPSDLFRSMPVPQPLLDDAALRSDRQPRRFIRGSRYGALANGAPHFLPGLRRSDIVVIHESRVGSEPPL